MTAEEVTNLTPDLRTLILTTLDENTDQACLSEYGDVSFTSDIEELADIVTRVVVARIDDTAAIDYSEWWSEDGGKTNVAVDVRNDNNVLVQVGALRLLLQKAGYESVRTVVS